MGEKMMTLVELRDAIAKAIADAVGNGMREKYERHAEAALTVVAPQLLLTAKHAESDHLTQPAQAVDVWAIRCIARLLRALSPDGEEWRSSNPNNATVLDVRKLADKLTAALPNANGKEG